LERNCFDFDALMREIFIDQRLALTGLRCDAHTPGFDCLFRDGKFFGQHLQCGAARSSLDGLILVAFVKRGTVAVNRHDGLSQCVARPARQTSHVGCGRRAIYVPENNYFVFVGPLGNQALIAAVEYGCGTFTARPFTVQSMHVTVSRRLRSVIYTHNS
jgi:hypothetical protein